MERTCLTWWTMANLPQEAAKLYLLRASNVSSIMQTTGAADGRSPGWLHSTFLRNEATQVCSDFILDRFTWQPHVGTSPETTTQVGTMAALCSAHTARSGTHGPVYARYPIGPLIAAQFPCLLHREGMYSTATSLLMSYFIAASSTVLPVLFKRV